MSLLEIVALFARMGALSFGGGLSVLAELQRELVEDRAIMSEREFATAFALGQATPGPGILYLIPLGFRIGGVPGAAAALLSFLVPPLLFQILVAQRWEQLSRAGWVRAINRTLVPLSLGLIGGSVHTLGTPLLGDPMTVLGLVLATTAALMVRTSPAVIVLGAGLLGLVGVL
ncbi:MAG TPA: chromate transporter [Candidatus Limnocylindria bacterium]|nr:chromate transporter [Candidatus Limnocylindria bacterium]